MKNITMLAIASTACLVCVGWLWIDSVGLWFLIGAVVMATVALITVLRKKS